MVHRPDRLDEILELFTKYKLTVKRIRFVHPTIDKSPNHVLIEASKMGLKHLKVEPPLILYTHLKVYSDELKDIYGGRSYATTITR